MSHVKTISPERAVELMKQGAALIDIRDTHEYANENIPGARHYALSQIDASHPVRAGDTVLIYHCKSGGRTNANARRLAAASGKCDVYLLGRGIEAWKRAGLPTSASAGHAANDSRPQPGFLGRLSALFR